jgi:hypothetical protein
MKTPFASRRFPILIIVCLLALTACGIQPAAESSQQSPYVVEPLFEQFYAFFGGQSRLGVALSPGIVEGNIQKQYFENALLVYNPALSPSDQ